MAATNRLFQDLIEFATDADPGSAGTSLSAPGLADLVAVADPDFVALTLDPDAENGDPEIVWVTAHTGSATTATIARAQEGTSARAHPVSTKVAAALTADAVEEVAPTGMISMFGGASPPRGWRLCDGSAVSRTGYAGLFNEIGTTYGAGDGSTTFNLPDLQQRFPLGKAASGTGSTLGGTGGAIDHAHTGPSHAHSNPNTGVESQAPIDVNGDESSDPQGGVLVADADHTHPQANTGASGTGNTGTANPPYLVVNYIIRT